MTVAEPPQQSPRNPAAPENASPDEVLRRHVAERVARLQSSYLQNNAAAVASMARLRRAVTSVPGADPSVWTETLDGVPNRLAGKGDRPSTYENAIHIAVTLHAIHQQSQAGRMHQSGHPLGRSLRLLTKRINSDASAHESPVMRRFHALGTAHSLAEATHHLRGLITQLRGEAIPLDYGLLARDLRRIQDHRLAAGVRLDWGREFHRLHSESGDPIEASGTESHPTTTALSSTGVTP